jgi:sugar phosphate isomerase/epimerase
MDRKEFIKTSTALAAGAALLPSLSLAAQKRSPGLQTYSLRKNLGEDFEGTLEYVAKVGYKNIEAYGLKPDGLYYGKITPKQHEKVVKDLGMELKSTHCSYAEVEKAKKMIEAAAETGMKYLVIPSTPRKYRNSADGWKQVAENFNKIGEICKENGLMFGYHNHAFEFEKVEGIIPQEYLIEATEVDLVCFEADLFWVMKGGYDAVELIKKYPGRIKLFHVKEATEEMEETTIGQGIIDFKSMFKAAKKDLEYYFVEDERSDDPLGNIKADYEYVAAQNFMS